MSRLTSFLGGACCGFGAGFVWKHRDIFVAPARLDLSPRLANVERAHAAVAASVGGASHTIDTAALESAIGTMVSDAGSAWQKLHDLQTDIFATNDRGRSSFEQAFQAFSRWPELLKRVIDAHPPAPAPQIATPPPAYPEVAATPELLALERDLTRQTEQRNEIELAAAEHEGAAAAMLSAVGELRQSLPQQGI